MGNFLVYILKSAVCLAMFYLFYRLLLSKETFHRFNRMALLGVSDAALVPAAFGKSDGGTGFAGKCTSDVDGGLAADVPME